jgi:exopolyphosphatase/guanosine-5'-triphosphate,3'-diphosphate pyrophosphatase
MRIAAIDCGSNSFHLLIADYSGHDQMTVVEDDKSLLYLGAEVASNGSISQASLLRAKRVMRHYQTLIERHNVDIVKCVATSAIRSAENGGDVIEKLSKVLGFPVRVISGEEEAKTIFRAIRAVSTLPETRILGCDMGGGSLELMAGQRDGLESAISVPLGASRVARELAVSDPLSIENSESLRLTCKNHFAEFNAEFPKDLFSHVVASSGTLTTIISMARAKFDGYISPPQAQLTATSYEMKEICTQIISLPKKQRRNLLGYDKTRDEYLAAAAVIASEISKLVSKDAPWIISPYALREGIVLTIADEQNEHVPVDQSSVAQRTVEDLEYRMGAFTPVRDGRQFSPEDSLLIKHGRKTSQLALQIYDGLSTIHKNSTKDRKLLEYGSRLHDIGETISHSKHDEHGSYILSSIPLVGLSPEDALILRAIVRWHRTKKPKLNDRFIGTMTNDQFERAIWLAAILRIADGADAGKSGSIESLNVVVKPDLIFIRCHTKNDCELEMYSARRKRKLLETISNKDVVIEQDLSTQKVAQD